jgi:hypothetical protein
MTPYWSDRHSISCSNSALAIVILATRRAGSPDRRLCEVPSNKTFSSRARQCDREAAQRLPVLVHPVSRTAIMLAA